MKSGVILFLLLSSYTLPCTAQHTGPGNGYYAQPFAGANTAKDPGNNVMLVYQAKNNDYWFANWEEGLYRYDGKTMQHFTTRDGLPHNRVDEIKEDRAGHIYFNTQAGICRYQDNRFMPLAPVQGSPADWALRPGDLWFKSARYNGEVYRYDGRSLYRLKMPATPLGEAYIAKHPQTADPYAVYCIYEDTKGNIWFGTAVLGACRYNGHSFDWISEQDMTELHDGPSNGIRSVAEDRNGSFWFNTAYRYEVYEGNKRGSGFYKRVKSAGSMDGRPGGALTEYLSIAKGRNGHLWIATYNNGVWRYNGSRFTHYVVRDGQQEVSLYSVYRDRKGDLWLGTRRNGVFRFNGRTFERWRLR